MMNETFNKFGSSEVALNEDCFQRLRAYQIGLSISRNDLLGLTQRAWFHSCGCDLIAPAAPAAVRDFIQVQAASGISGKPLKPQTIKQMISIVSDIHVHVLDLDDPTKHILVTSEMKALYRERGSRSKPTAALRLKGDVSNVVADDPLPGSIIHMLRALKSHRSGWALRARVVLGLGADTGRGRSDYVRLNVTDVVTKQDGSGQVLFGANRSASEIGEAPKFVSPDTMSFVSEWLEWREKAAPGSTAADAPMLVRIDQMDMPGGRLSVWGYVDVLKNIMRHVGSGAHVSGNSFQAGLKMDLAAIRTTKVGVANSLGFKEI